MAYYFGYGSNMSSRYLQSVRRVFPSRSTPATLNDYQLVMNLKGPNFIEPSFANIRYLKGAKVEGILHEIKQIDLDRIIASEGETYEIIEAPVELCGSKLVACTFKSKEELEEEIPASRRYMKILIKAAIDNGLSSEYINNLKMKKSVYYPLLSEIFAIRVYLWVKRRSRHKSA